MATLTPAIIAEGGVALAAVAAAGGGDQFANPNDARTFLEVINGGAGAITVTITAQTASFNVPGRGTLTKANGGGSVAAGATKLFGPFAADAFNDSSGNVQVSYSGVTSVTVQAFRLPAP